MHFPTNMTALSEPTPTTNQMTSDEDNDVMNLTLRPARRSFLIDSLLEERQKQLQSEASTASPPSNEQTEGEQSDSESPQIESSSDHTENIHAPTSVPLSMPSTPVTAVPPSQPGNLNFFQALARLMATNQTALMSQNAAARFRMMNLSAMAPSLAAFGQVQQQSVTAVNAFRGMMGPMRADMGSDSPLTRLLGAGRPNMINPMAAGGSSRSYPASSSAGSGGSATGSVRSSNVKKYRCDVCEKTFSRSNTLITHKRIHTGEKPFRCEHCGRAFRQPGNLTRHRLTHTTDKPFVCMECGKAFNRASNLHTHTRTHAPAPARLHLGF